MPQARRITFVSQARLWVRGVAVGHHAMVGVGVEACTSGTGTRPRKTKRRAITVPRHHGTLDMSQCSHHIVHSHAFRQLSCKLEAAKVGSGLQAQGGEGNKGRVQNGIMWRQQRCCRLLCQVLPGRRGVRRRQKHPLQFLQASSLVGQVHSHACRSNRRQGNCGSQPKQLRGHYVERWELDSSIRCIPGNGTECALQWDGSAYCTRLYHEARHAGGSSWVAPNDKAVQEGVAHLTVPRYQWGHMEA